MPTCDRCQEATSVTTMSRFNTEIICVPCEEREQAHPEYEMARAAEEAAVRAGNLNFKGVGLPDDLRSPKTEPKKS